MLPNFSKKADLTAVILTRNESKNLPHCLESLVGWVAQVVIVDSGSTDETVALAQAAGARVVEHSFVNHTDQWNWAFRSLSISTPWMILLDADHRVSPQLRDKLLEELPQAPSDVDGFYVQRRLIFRGKWIRWGGCTRPTLKVVRTEKVWCDERDLPDMRFYVKGKTALIDAPLLEDNLNEYDSQFWFNKQRKFARVQALSELRWKQDRSGWAIEANPTGNPDQRILWQKQNWYYLPRYLRSIGYFFYRYFLLGGFLDGWKGLQFHAVQGFWMRWMADVELGRLRGKP